MAISLADYHKIDSKAYDATGAFDPILTIDTRLFIDPRLLFCTTVPEFKESHQKITEYFAQVMRVVVKIEKQGDPFWRTADKMLTFPEVNGLCIGYSKGSDNGSGMGPELRADLLGNIQQIVKAGVDDPSLFELVGIFQDKIGPDRISDMIAKIIIADLVAFTQRVCSDCGIPMESCTISKSMQQEDLPMNPFGGTPIILVAKELLSELPVANDYGDIQQIAESNEALREELNAIIGGSLSKATTADKKKALRKTFVAHPDVLRDVLRAYLESKPDFYDFEADPAGEVVWYTASKRAVVDAPLELSLSAQPTLEDVEKVVLAICEQFRQLIENNQLAKLLYDSNGDPKHESAAQLLFFGVAIAYCRANDLDLAPESDAGRGPVDFKVSRGFKGRVLVEIKLTSNLQLKHGFETQLPIYQAAENAIKGIYLVIDNGGYTETRMMRFKEAVKDAGVMAPRVLMVDGSIRASASKAKE